MTNTPSAAAQPDQPLQLYDYWRSSAAYRVRIALKLKGLDYQQHSVHLVRQGGEQHQADYVALNPQHLVPTLIHGEQVLTQSLAIIEYLDECFPSPGLLPHTALARARCRAMALLVACDIHPLNNLRVLQYLSGPLAVDETQKQAWYAHWIQTGFTAYERHLEQSDGPFSCGEQLSLADCCLLPQVYNAERFQCDLTPFPRIRALSARLREIPAVAAAAPEVQPDAQ